MFQYDLLGGFNRQAFNELLVWASEKGASDIYLTSERPPKIKLDKKIVTVNEHEIEIEPLFRLLEIIHLPSTTGTLESGDAVDFPYAIYQEETGKNLRFRCTASGCDGLINDKGVSIVIRTIPSLPPTVKQLGLEQEVIDLMNNKYGLVMMSGPTGSGKSTTLGAMVQYYAVTKPGVVISYEDPVEFALNGFEGQVAEVIQKQIGKHVPSFKKAIKNALRCAPDVIYIGEARDDETISGCIRASNTGHLVISTTHVNDVAGTIARLATQFAREHVNSIVNDLIQVMRGIVNQRLYPKRGGGLIALREVLTFTEEIRHKLSVDFLKNPDITTLVKELVHSHGQPLIKDAISKFGQGYLDIAEIISIIKEVGYQKHFEELPRLINKLAENQVITPEEKVTWLETLEQLNV